MVAFRKMVPILPILAAIVFSVLLRYTDSDCPFGIFKLFIQLIQKEWSRNGDTTDCNSIGNYTITLKPGVNSGAPEGW
jgi:adenylate cyclase